MERDAASSSDSQQQQQHQNGIGVPLVLGCVPLSLTCGLYKGRIVADPDHEEEALMGGSVSVVVDQQQRLLGKWYLHKGSETGSGDGKVCVSA